jgi:hypothetical protein
MAFPIPIPCEPKPIRMGEPGSPAIGDTGWACRKRGDKRMMDTAVIFI